MMFMWDSLITERLIFVAVNGDDISYYQVLATTFDENNLKRELAPFKRVGDNYPKYLITFD